MNKIYLSIEPGVYYLMDSKQGLGDGVLRWTIWHKLQAQWSPHIYGTKAFGWACHEIAQS